MAEHDENKQQPATTIDRRALARNTKPIPCYAVDQIPPKHGGDALYTSLASAVANGQATRLQQLIIPPCDARSWRVDAGQLFRIICSHGPQVADMNLWNAHHTTEHFYSSKTRQLHATHVTTGDRLWSNMPFLRPLATIVHDTIAYGWDDDGAGVHDVIGSRCDPYTHWRMTHCAKNVKKASSGGGKLQQHDTAAAAAANNACEKHTCCHSNLTRQCLRDGMKESDVHDVLNVFMCTGFDKVTHQYFTKPSPVQVGDYLEFLAETDLIVSASTCPQGDVSMACGIDGGEVEPKVFPLTVEGTCVRASVSAYKHDAVDSASVLSVCLLWCCCCCCCHSR